MRLIILTGFITSKPDKSAVDKLIVYLPQLPETTRLVFLESQALQANHRVLKLAEKEKSGYAKQFSQPEGNDLERWIRGQVEMKNGRIAPHAVYLLAANIGSDLNILDNEIEKLVLYAGDEEIKSDHVNLLCPYVAEASIFELVDAIGNRNGQKASLLPAAKTKRRGRTLLSLFHVRAPVPSINSGEGTG